MGLSNKADTFREWTEFLRNKAIEIFQKYSLPRWMVFIVDNTSVFVLFFVAYLLRYNLNIDGINFNAAVSHALLTLIVYAVFSIAFRSYSGLIRHTTLTDISQVFVVTTVSSLVLICFSICSRFLQWNEKMIIPISIILIHYVTITVFLFFIRILIKMLFRFALNPGKDRKHVLIYGAGEMGFIVKRLILSDPDGEFDVSGFLDNKKHLQGKMINGLPVFNPKILSPGFLSKNNINTLIIAIKQLSSKRKSEIIRSAMNLGLQVLETPQVDKWLNGHLQLNQLQKVKLQDLLGRDQIQLNMDLIGKGLNKKVILVTGAAGSIGSEIVRQFARFETRKIILVDQAETPMFHLENELRDKYRNLQIKPILADVTNSKKMEDIFAEFKPEIVFHAAAYKHVPLMEENPHEAFRVNIGSTVIVSRLAAKFGVEKFVMISTDKSVNPSSVMGASKRMCEMIVQKMAEKEGVVTQFVITRFGNVLGSNGSVVPLFAKQIEEGGPVTVTHPEITRYFMTIPEACELVLEAGFMGRGGEIFVFDMGKPVKIVDLATNMIKLSGLEPVRDIKISFTGLRPGEKLFEELLSDKEDLLPTYHPKIKIARTGNHECKDLVSRVDGILQNLYSLSKSEIIGFFLEMLPEFKTNNGYHLNKPSPEKESSEDDKKVIKMHRNFSNIRNNISQI